VAELKTNEVDDVNLQLLTGLIRRSVRDVGERYA